MTWSGRQVAARFLRYDANISAGGCSPGAVISFLETVTAALGTLITQTVGSQDNRLGPPVTSDFTLP